MSCLLLRAFFSVLSIEAARSDLSTDRSAFAGDLVVKVDLQEMNPRGFVEAPVPQMMLGMPGCDPVAVNAAHRQAFPEAGHLRVVQTTEEFVEAIERYQPGQFSVEPLTLRKHPVCYCAQRGVEEMIALRSADCAYDEQDKALREQKIPGLSGFGYVFSRRSDQPGPRLYSVASFYSAWHPSLEPTPQNASLLHLTRVALGGMRLKVWSIDGNGTPPKELVARLIVGGQPTGQPIKVAVQQTEALSLYFEVYQALEEARQMLDRGRPHEEIKNKLQALVRTDKDYEQLSDSILALFEDAPLKDEVLHNRLEAMKDCLLDAPFIREPALKQIERLGAREGLVIESEPEGGVQTDRLAEGISVEEGAAAPEPPRGDVNMLLEQTRRQLDEERARFAPREEELKAKYSGKYILMLGGEVIDSDEDEVTLATRAAQQLQGQQRASLLVKVGEPAPVVALPFAAWYSVRESN